MIEDFTYQDYRAMLCLLAEHRYVFADYHDSNQWDKCVILRHDVDNSLKKAIKVAEIEVECNAKSTWFVLLKTDMYNPASMESIELMHELMDMGHEIGLHFDEAAYQKNTDVVEAIIKETDILSNILGCGITTVSMHRPSEKTLKANYQIPGMVNSYSAKYFNDYKYLSDSRRHFREPVRDIITGEKYCKLHILTHAFWYNEKSVDMHDNVKAFIDCARLERYYQLKSNIRDFGLFRGNGGLKTVTTPVFI